jgi:nucleoside-diphosphate-sugar epimerase
MRVLVTGSTGFLGSNVVRACLASGIEVCAFSRKCSNFYRLDDIMNKISFYDTSENGINDALSSCDESDIVLHAATCYGRQGESMGSLLEANSVLPLNILEKTVRLGMTFINIDTILDPNINAYSLSKHQFAQWGRLFAKSGKFRFVNVRLEHLYGPLDEISRFVPNVIRQCLSNNDILPFTNGQQLRDFIYIEDAVAGIIAIMNTTAKQSMGWSEFDLGSGCAISIRQIVEKIHQFTNSHAKLNFGVLPYRDNETMESHSDIAKLTELGWKCRVPLDIGLKETIQFEKARMNLAIVI